VSSESSPHTQSRPLRSSLAALLLVAALPATARITCCEVDGRRSCGDPPPVQCLNKAKTVFDKGGVAKEVEAPLTQEQKAAREAAAAHKAEEEKKAAEQARRDRALLDSYASEKDIDQAEGRAIAEIEKNTADAQARLDAALKKQKKLNDEKEFYTKKKLPAQLESQIKDNESEIASQQKALQDKDVNVAAVKTRFEADKTRYRQLRAGGK
jgi:hypothetical protein